MSSYDDTKPLNTIAPPMLSLALSENNTLVHEGWQQRLIRLLKKLDNNRTLTETSDDDDQMVLPDKLIVPFFTDIDSKIIELIRIYDWVKVCTAWLTSSQIIDVLSEADAQIITGWPPSTNTIGDVFDYYDKIHKLGDKIRMYKPDKGIIHHKFIVFGNDDSPQAVWTGSYNMSYQAQFNLENGVFIQHPATASAFMQQFEMIWSLSLAQSEKEQSDKTLCPDNNG